MPADTWDRKLSPDSLEPLPGTDSVKTSKSRTSWSSVMSGSIARVRGKSNASFCEDADGTEESAAAMISTEESVRGTRTGSVLFSGTRHTGLRGSLSRLLRNPNFDLVMGAVIICNVGVMVVQTDMMAPCAGNASAAACESSITTALDRVFLSIYTIEVSIRLFVLRLHTFKSMWNNLDIVIVVLGYVDLTLTLVDTGQLPGPSMSLLRIFRVFRLLRAVRIFQKIPELYAMLRGFVSAMQSMFWGFVMILILLLLFAVMCVELVHPLSLQIHEDNEYCKEAFALVWHCVIMFFQILVAGDSWGQCTIPIIKAYWWSFLIFAVALICVQLGFMNLILAVIVERASRAQEEDEEELRKLKLKSARKATNRLNNLFATIDEDNSGTISLDELLDGFDSNTEMQNMFGKLDMGRTDIQNLFELMDTEDAGELSYEFLVDNLRTCQLDDTRKSMTMLRLQAAEITRICKKLHTGGKGRARTATSTDSPRRATSSTSVHGTLTADAACLVDPGSPAYSTRSSPSAGFASADPGMISFDKEVRALRAIMDAEFLGMRDIMTQLNHSVQRSLCSLVEVPLIPSSPTFSKPFHPTFKSNGLQAGFDGKRKDASAWRDGSEDSSPRAPDDKGPSQSCISQVNIKGSNSVRPQHQVAESRESGSNAIPSSQSDPNSVSGARAITTPEDADLRLAATLDDATSAASKRPGSGEASLCRI